MQAVLPAGDLQACKVVPSNSNMGVDTTFRQLASERVHEDHRHAQALQTHTPGWQFCSKRRSKQGGRDHAQWVRMRIGERPLQGVQLPVKIH
jgi:hypothetical protein